MIDRVQRLLYQLCDKDPSEFWDYTQAETNQMIDVKIKDREQRDKRDSLFIADLKATLYNAPLGPYMKEGEKFPYRVKDFLPKALKPKVEISEAEKTRNWIKAGDAMMKVVHDHEKETGVKV